MNVLLIGSGGREHALAWKLAASPMLSKLYCAPGNPGMAKVAECVAIDVSNHQTIITFCKNNKISFVVVGPEAPLVAGIVDDLTAAGIKAFGPSKFAAQLEGSKGFTKDICRANNIPTAAYQRFTALAPALDYLNKVGAPIVIKADGLAAGKGVTVAMTEAEAVVALHDIFDGLFGDAACVIEEFLEGEEASFFVLSDGKSVLPLATAQDHKRVGEGDTGPNTGGMGAYSPAPVVTEAVHRKVMDRIMVPSVKAMAAEGRPYRGVLYAGLMIQNGEPRLLEFNARLGDPEAQPLLVRMASDLVPVLQAVVEGRLHEVEIAWRPEPAVCVVLAAGGYPGPYEKGKPIAGLRAASRLKDVVAFHAGTALQGGRVVTAGGRVLGVTAVGSPLASAIERAYRAVRKIRWDGMHYRTDIGRKALRRGAP